ncbi:Hypothetical protein Minf_2352 [Methylacidiphilum infernorum V4]|uniref:Uncharacterized protein n=1 Tax=Methylacidiphilum infernorum (isolate V4) TaxID=481448 RepID=B3E0H7_METI4|nr:Hypothetical protein Minf_2352 [Methylacidiphilum infernorum V4]
MFFFIHQDLRAVVLKGFVLCSFILGFTAEKTTGFFFDLPRLRLGIRTDPSFFGELLLIR